MEIMKKSKERGITLIALVVTIIILLILAGVAIIAVTSENGLFKKAEEATKISDIVDTKEQIKLELAAVTLTMDKEGQYDNQDVIKAVKKVTGKDVAEKALTVESKKGNDVDISDLWDKIQETVKFSIVGEYSGTSTYKEIKIEPGTTWRQFFDNGSVERINQLDMELFGFPGNITEINEYADRYSLLVDILYEYDDEESGSIVTWRTVLRNTLGDYASVGYSPDFCHLDVEWGNVPHDMDDIIDTSAVIVCKLDNY